MKTKMIHTIVCFFWENSVTVFLHQYNKENKKGILLSSAHAELIDGWEHIDKTLDKAITEVETSSGYSGESLLYILSSSFTDHTSGAIRKPFLNSLKSLVNILGFKSLGYICVKEIAERVLEENEFIKRTGYVIEVDSTTITIYLYTKNKIRFVGSTAKTDDIGSDILSVISDHDNLILTSVLYIYGQQLDTPYTKKLSTCVWPNHLFVQIPKIVPIDHDKLYSAMNTLIERNLDLSEKNVSSEPQIVTKTGFYINKDISYLPEEMPDKRKNFFNLAGFLKEKVSKIRFPHLIFSNKLVYLIFGILFVSIFFSVGIILLHRAEIKILYNSKTVKEDFDMKLVEGSLTDQDQVNMIKGSETVTVLINQKTTGKQEKGDKAKGTVVIHNWGNQPVSLKKGEIITAVNSTYTYTLDSDIQVPAAKEVGIGTKETGKLKTTVTASSIGTEYNLSKDTKFTVSNRSQNSIFAVSDTAFIGGSKSTVTTVSKNDFMMAEASATKSAIIEFKKRNKSSKEIIYIYEAIKTKILEATPSAEIGEEKTELTYTADVNITFTGIKTRTLQGRISEMLSKNLKPVEKIASDSMSFSVSTYKEDSSTVNVLASAKTELIIEKDKIQTRVAGKSKDNAKREILALLPVQTVQITIRPEFIPFFSNRLPFIKSFISTDIQNR